MAQHDYVIANGTGAAVRSDLNNALAAIVSLNSGATEPTTTYAYQLWADTTAGVLKLRDGSNAAWITLRELDGTLTIEDGTAAAPGLAFADDLNTGIYTPGADEIAISTNGVERARIDSSGNLGIGTTSPASLLHIYENSTNGASITLENTDGTAYLTANNDFLYLDADSQIFRTQTGSERARIDSSGRLLVGTSSTSETARAVFQGNSSSNPGRVYFSAATNAPSNGATLAKLIFADSGHVSAAEIDVQRDGGTWTSGSSQPTRLVFSTTADGASSPTERMRINSAGTTTFYGSVGISVSGSSSFRVTSSSLANLDTIYTGAIVGGQVGHIGVYKHSGITNPAGFLRVECEDGNAGIIWVDNSDIVRVSNSMANVGTTGGTVVGSQTSDERLKNILGPIEYGLETVKQLAPVRYVLKDDPSVERLGFIAQQTQPVVPEAVYDTKEQIEGEPENAPNKLAMEYVTLVPVLVNAIKELSAEVDVLKSQLQAQ